MKLRGIIFQTNILHKPPRKLWLSDIFRGYWKRTLAWDALKIKNWTYFCLTQKNFCFYISKKYQFHQQSKKYIQFFNKTATELLKFVVSTCRTFSCHSTLKLLRQDLKIVPSPISPTLLFKDSHYCGRKMFLMTKWRQNIFAHSSSLSRNNALKLLRQNSQRLKNCPLTKYVWPFSIIMRKTIHKCLETKEFIHSFE